VSYERGTPVTVLYRALVRRFCRKAGATLGLRAADEDTDVFSTLNPQPSTLNPQPSTLNPQPSTLNQQPSTLNPQPSTLIPQPPTPNTRAARR